MAAIAGRCSGAASVAVRKSADRRANGCTAIQLRAAACSRSRHMVRNPAARQPRNAAAAAAAAATAAAGGAGPEQAAPAGGQQRAGQREALPPSRLQQEVELLVAIDVEYTHLQLAPSGRHVSLAAEVCAVDASGKVLLYEHCNPLEGQLAQHRWRHVGGQPAALWQHAPPLSEVRRQLQELLKGRVLVGHHLRKDLAALALSHPGEATRDTLRYRELQGRGGSGRKLRDLSAEKLGRAIQPSGRRHSPREDAQAAMDLYLEHVHFEEQYMRYDDMVERHLAELLGSTAGASRDAGAGSGTDESGSSGTDAGGSSGA